MTRWNPDLAAAHMAFKARLAPARYVVKPTMTAAYQVYDTQDGCWVGAEFRRATFGSLERARHAAEAFARDLDRS